MDNTILFVEECGKIAIPVEKLERNEQIVDNFESFPQFKNDLTVCRHELPLRELQSEIAFWNNTMCKFCEEW